jgi:hypothetical protein
MPTVGQQIGVPVISENLDFIAFMIAVFTVPVVIGALSSSPQRAALWLYLVLVGGMAFEAGRDWWHGREVALLSNGVGEFLYVLVLAFVGFGGLVVLGHRLRHRGRTS